MEKVCLTFCVYVVSGFNFMHFLGLFAVIALLYFVLFSVTACPCSTLESICLFCLFFLGEYLDKCVMCMLFYDRIKPK